MNDGMGLLFLVGILVVGIGLIDYFNASYAERTEQREISGGLAQDRALGER